MRRREFLLSAAAAGAIALVPSAHAASPRFASDRITITVQGSGPDVILIPGLTASPAMWKGTVAAVPGYRYHLVQVAGFAGAPARGNASGDVVAPVAAEVARYIRETGVKAPAVVGHSMGGTVAMMVAARHPALVGRLMVVDMLPAPAGLFGASAQGIRPLADTLRDVLTASPGGRRLLDSLLSGVGGEADPASRSDGDVVARTTHELALLDLTPELPKIAASMTVVYALPPEGGATDPAHVVRAYKAAYATARSAALVPVANSGHMIMYDQPGPFRSALKAFLAAR